MKNKHHALLILSNHKHSIVKRQIASLEIQGFKDDIIFCDGSPENIAETGLRLPEHARHIHLPPSTSGADGINRSFFRRIRTAVEATDAEIITLCPADDFLFIPVVAQAVDLMIQKPEFSTCLYNGLTYMKGEVADYRQVAIGHGDWRKRVAFHAIGGSSTFWASHRRSTLAKIVAHVDELDVSHTVIETTMYFLMIALGKVARINRLGRVRDIFDPPRDKPGELTGFKDFGFWTEVSNDLRRITPIVVDILKAEYPEMAEREIIDIYIEYFASFFALRLDRSGPFRIPEKTQRFKAVDAANSMATHDELLRDYKENCVPVVRRVQQLLMTPELAASAAGR